MKIKEIFFTILGIALVAGASYFYFKTGGPAAVNSPAENLKTKSEITIEDKKITDNTNPFVIDITYPYISQMDDLNKKIENSINSWLADFKKNSLDNDQIVKRVDPEAYAKYPRKYDFTLTYEKGEIDKNIISIVFEVYAFEGGAHGATNFYPLNYNSETKQEITLSSLFPEQPDYLQKISDYCGKNLTQQLTAVSGDYTDTDWIQRGTEPTTENFSIFLINKDNLVFYFPQYQVAPYAAGDFKVTMPR